MCNPTWQLKEGRLTEASEQVSETEMDYSGIQVHFLYFFRVHLNAPFRIPRRSLHSWHGSFTQRWAGPSKTNSFWYLNFFKIGSMQSGFNTSVSQILCNPTEAPVGFVVSFPFPYMAHLRVQLWALLISLRSFSSPNTCTLEPTLECWLRRNNRRLWACLGPRPSQYLLQFGATVLKLLPSRTQQWEVSRGF